MDLKNILDNEDKNEENKNLNVQKHKKPIQLKEIERRSRSNNIEKINNNYDINKLIDEEKKLIYNKSWNKLEQGLKINRFNLFIEELKLQHNLNNIQKMQLQELLIKACEKNKLNKNSEIIYDFENAKINEIKILEFNENTKIFSLNFPEAKHKTKNKSKSNIERILR